ncbi:LPS assembly lipoprotein LptE [Pseudoxanthomonas indica]|uniref:LPS-assembly lipoprotein LptE n=1 Tax=Pseudoxanthomonas indica TaxID=428993 RepID=A0A1T5J961_9GAMM|nr:LPS assembly lipoprotein LptE [Pseudoxanthomonas indica]GGD57221.1 hypothetical protein GCM10007235_31960 [Pseudoxanthomonas indica]SKC47919.1 LPS-assembly lipoprotein [Pseudoxanthomonas indica]
MTRIRLFAAAALILSLAGCGFHLRNQIALPEGLGPVLVVSNVRYSQLTQPVERGLQSSGAQIAPEGSKDVATLRIVSERWGDQPIAIDELGRAQEYSLRYAAIFVFQTADGTVLVPQQVVELSRDYVSPPQNATGTSTEREILADELRREMAASILRRIDGVLRTRSLVVPPVAEPADGAVPLEGSAPADVPPPADAATPEPAATPVERSTPVEPTTPADGT